MYLGECITDSTNIFLVGEDYRKKEKRGLERRIFRKNFNHAEIIGEELCKIRNLSCPHFFLMADSKKDKNKYISYKIAKRDGLNVKLGSYDVTKNGVFYFTIDDVFLSGGRTKFEGLLSMTPSAKNSEELANEMCELFALDLYMGQADRFSNNILFSFNIHNGEIHLESIFDFQYSLKDGYNCEDFIYDNDLYTFRNIEDFKIFMIFYPNFREMLRSYLDVDLEQVVRDGYRRNGLIVPESKVSFYAAFDRNRKELIKKIIL